MAGRKTKAAKTTSSEARAFVVVLEEIRAQNKVFGEGQQLLHEQQQMLRQEMSAGFEEVNRRFERVEHEITEIREDITEIRQDITEIRQDVGLVKIAVLDHSRELKEIRVTLDKKVDRDQVEGIVQRVVARGR
jgi:gas vesicle protein